MASRSRKRPVWVWREVSWPRPFDPDAAVELLDRIAADTRLGPVALEARAEHGRIRYLIGIRPHHVAALSALLRGLLPEARLVKPPKGARPSVTLAGRVSASHSSLALNVDRVTATARAVLAGLAAARGHEEHREQVVLQVLLGARVAPSLLPAKPQDPRASWLDVIRGTIPSASAEARASMKTRASLHGFKAIVRIGAAAETPERARGLVLSVISGLRVAEAAGVRLRLTPDDPARLNRAVLPWRMPLRLSAREAVLLTGWPVSKDAEQALPGMPGAHPKLLPPPDTLQGSDRPFAVTTAPGTELRIGIMGRDSLQHTLLLGPTGAGKSSAMLTLIMDAITAGRGVVVIDPKTDLVNDILARIPDARRGDVVVLDPTDPHPVGLNPFSGAKRNPELVADSILAVFKELFADSWGPRTQDILTSALITLAHRPGATLTMLPSLLTDQRFRRTLTAGLTDKIGLGPFWAAYEAMSAEQRAQVIAPVMNKLRQFLLRPALRAVLGQSEPLFELADVFTKRRIVLVPLNKGLIGAESARLLGSLVVSTLWPLILARAALPAERRHVVNVFIDEVQDYLALPTDLADALAQARGLGVGFTLAHQYRTQLPPALRAGVDANARNRIIFGLNATDAAEVAKQAPGLEAQDFMLLPRYHVYTNLMHSGHATGWFSAATLPAPSPTTDPIELRALSSQSYGRDAHEVEREVLDAIGLRDSIDVNAAADAPIGRRRNSDERAK